MKKFLITLMFLFSLLALAAPPGVMRTNVTLSWTYPTNALTTNMIFKLYSSTNVTAPVSSWPLFATIPATNFTSSANSFTSSITANQRFFVMTTSNWWGESSFSNVAQTPALPLSDVDLALGQ